LALKQNRLLLLLVKLTISSFLLYIVLSKTGFEKVFSTLKDISIPAFIGTMLLYIFAQFISTVRWKLFLPHTLGIRKLFSLYLIGSFFSTLLPGIIGGDAVKGFYLYQATRNGSLTLASIFMDRYIGLVVLILICTLALPFGFGYFQGSRIAWLVPLIALSFITASLLIFGLRLGQRIKLISNFYHYFHAYRNQKDIIAKSMLLSVIVQLAGILSIYVLAHGFKQDIPFTALLVFVPLIVLFSTIPISISGLGMREGAYVVLFSFINIKPEVATAISLSWFLAIAASSLLGLVAYLRYKKEAAGNIDLSKLNIGESSNTKK
jgi:uncharacterized membrane protein YbhN (UPF0104 family)